MSDSVVDADEQEQVDDLTSVRSSVIYEVIRQEGAHELGRPFGALWWSGVIAGLAISMSVLCKGFLVAVLPKSSWVPAVSSLGYTVGFLIVILGRMQLFTENTITPILTVFIDPCRYNLKRLTRLWSIVFVANMTGCLLMAALVVFANILPELQLAGVLEVSRHYAQSTALQNLAWGIPAGFLIASLVWILPRMDGAGEVLVIVIVTYMIGVGGLSHVVAGSTELFVLVLRGELSAGAALFSGILPALLGNVIGGTFTFSALTYAQIKRDSESWSLT